MRKWCFLEGVWQAVLSVSETDTSQVELDGFKADLVGKIGSKVRVRVRVVSVAGKHCDPLEAQKAEYLRIPAWYERRVELGIAWDCRKASRCARGSVLTWEQELVPHLLSGRGGRTA